MREVRKMDRRGFGRISLSGFAGLAAWRKTISQGWAAVAGRATGAERAAGAGPGAEDPSQRLFPLTLPSREWVQFRAAGFSQPVCGVIYQRGDEVQHGMPLGGVSTGFLDVETNGTFGLSTLFNSGVPVRGPLRSPFLGINVAGRTWVLTLEKMVGTDNARDIHYWGHYPVVDLEYETTAPLNVGLRAWTPFIPGDVFASHTPAAVFEVRLRNPSPASRKGTLAFNFPGPTQAEAQIAPDSLRAKDYIDWFPVSWPAAKGLITAQRNEFSAGDLSRASRACESGDRLRRGRDRRGEATMGGLALDGRVRLLQWAGVGSDSPPTAPCN